MVLTSLRYVRQHEGGCLVSNRCCVTQALHTWKNAREALQRTVRSALFLVPILISVPAHAGVYKWVDDEGQVHYSEQPPEKGQHSQLHIQAAPSHPKSGSTQVFDLPNQPQSESTQSSGLSSQQQDQQRRLNEISARLQRERDEIDARNRQRAHDRSIEEQTAARDKEEIDRCNRNREVYCDKGVTRIRMEDEWRAIDAQNDKVRARMRGVVVP